MGASPTSPRARTGTTAPSAPAAGLRWDLCCRVVDNHGDLGVCWRLATDLAGRGDSVRLFVDDPTALAWMAPQGCPGVQVLAFEAAAGSEAAVDIVVEAFGCDPPPARRASLAAAQATGGGPVWINLEYLSAEAYVERSHGLPSPQPGGATKWFFYPGFTPATGGLLRGPGLDPAEYPGAGADADADGTAQRENTSASTHYPSAIDTLAARLNLPPPRHERWVSLFCYAEPAPPLAAWLADLTAHPPPDGRPTRVLLTPGPAQALVAALSPTQVPPGLLLTPLPWLPQPDYDTLLRACALNTVRGEDSLVRAIWTGRPWLWHIYPQHDGVHADKLDALVQRLLAAEPDLAAGPLGQTLPLLQRAWNGLNAGWPGLPAGPLWDDWARLCCAWRNQLAAQPDLATQLRAFAVDRLADRTALPDRCAPGKPPGPSSPGC